MAPDRPQGFEYDNEPKATGIRIVIPNLQELHRSAVQLASEKGDKTLKQLGDEAYAYFVLGEGESSTFRWKTQMDGLLVLDYEVLLITSYHHEEGEWINFTSFLQIGNAEASFEVARRAEQLRDDLKAKGFRINLEIDSHGSRELEVSRVNSDTSVTFLLGFKDYEDAVAWDGMESFTEFGNNPLVIGLGGNPNLIEFEEFAKQLGAYQDLAPQIISSLYEVFDLKIPDIEFYLTS